MRSLKVQPQVGYRPLVTVTLVVVLSVLLNGDIGIVDDLSLLVSNGLLRLDPESSEDCVLRVGIGVSASEQVVE